MLMYQMPNQKSEFTAGQNVKIQHTTYRRETL